ncbi:hypothetical protein [Mycolicibacterium iranicum]|uniref:Uncharacterized protein n=1 Tax=Mycolicibacterium iranicum TaxID=912594 RepID=A0ABT4HRB1_MYCIR|nr:hypothetical protein [Mycolicibacterium iranicum]MCZ0732212.1 hypothetical protein [Mycolicibacterium iranicum]
MMTTRSIGRRQRPPRLSGDTVTVEVTEPHAVFWQGEQRSGTLTDVPVELADHWTRRGWVARVEADEDPGPQRPPMSGVGAGRDDWAAYAASLGVHVDDEDKRADIIAKIDAADLE